jgi:hypothetical protein
VKPGDPIRLKDVLNPAPPPREKMVESVPQPTQPPDWEEVRPEDSLGITARRRVRPTDRDKSQASWTQTIIVGLIVLAFLIYNFVLK